MISYTDALKLITSTVQPLPAVEMFLLDAHGLILAQEVKARWDLPLLDSFELGSARMMTRFAVCR